MNYNETLNYIHSLKKFRAYPTLDLMRELLGKLSVIPDDLRIMHIAGTNGKGSVATMLASVAADAGLKVGLYTSPFIVDFRERITVNGEMIPQSDVVRLTKRIVDTGLDINEFELITAMGFMYFSEQKCDIVVLETGLGGLYDSTNVIKYPLCSVITHIGLDHTEVLGKTITEITDQKLGIAKDGCPLVVSPMQEEKAAQRILAVRPDAIMCKGENVKIISSDTNGNTFLYNGEEYSTKLIGQFQIYNAVTAVTVAKTVGIFSNENIKNGIKNAFIPARAELIDDRPTYLDGAHNPDGANALKEFVKLTHSPRTAVIGMMKDKNAEEYLSVLLPYFDRVITVEVENNPRSFAAEELKNIAVKYCKNVISAQSYCDALRKAEGNGVLFITGSLYLASDMRRLFIN